MNVRSVALCASVLAWMAPVSVLAQAMAIPSQQMNTAPPLSSAVLPQSRAATTTTGQPAAGTYTGTGYVASANAVCNATIGATWTATLFYPGPGKAGGVGYIQVNSNGNVGMVINKYPVSPAKNISTWSGANAISQTINGVSSTSYPSFSYVFTNYDAHSFSVVETYTYSNGCVEKLYYTYIANTM